MGYSDLNKVILRLSAAVLDVLELQSEWGSNVASCLEGSC